MSHIKNVQAFGKLTGICTGYGGQYNPGQQNLQVNAMTTLLINAQQVMDACMEAQAFYDQATNLRQAGFKGLRAVSSAVCTLLRASGASELTVKDAAACNRRIWGSRASRRAMAAKEATTTNPGGEQPPGASRTRLAFVSQVNNFARLVELVSVEPTYAPNEAAFTVAGLQQKLMELQGLNDLVAQAEIKLTQARRDRDDLYYRKVGNLVDTAIAAKQYIRGVFGYKSSQHMEVQKLRFTNPRK